MSNPTPAPGLAFIRKIATVETYGGSAIIVPEQARDKIAASQWEVVSVGTPEPCDDEDCERMHLHGFGAYNVKRGDYTPFAHRSHPCDLAPRDWVLCRKRSETPTPDPELFAIKQSDCIGRFEVTE